MDKGWFIIKNIILLINNKKKNKICKISAENSL